MTTEEAIKIINKAIIESENVIADLSKVKALAERKSMVREYYANIQNAEEEIEACKVAIEALKEIQQYREIGTVEECRGAMANKKKCEKQWHNDMENPLEPIKVYSALKSEILKLELRIKNRPKDISILDYTVIAALQKVLENNLEEKEDE